jgi:hypothetical protein
VSALEQLQHAAARNRNAEEAAAAAAALEQQRVAARVARDRTLRQQQVARVSEMRHGDQVGLASADHATKS